jgi:REP element-mobilizing transposase RayT
MRSAAVGGRSGDKIAEGDARGGREQRARSVREPASRVARRPRAQQLTIFSRGGARPGAGRKPRGEHALASHARREPLTRHEPVLVTVHLVAGCPNLRSERCLAIVRGALESGCDRFGFRLIEYSVQTNHLHLLAEAADARSLARGMQGLLVRVAKRLNREWGRRGEVFGDRYHARVLTTPREVRAALVDVLQNARKHGARLRGIDRCSSGPWFTGWRGRAAPGRSALPAAGSWLLRAGWRAAGLLGTEESPAAPKFRAGEVAGSSGPR